MRLRRTLPDIRRPLFFYDRRPALIRSVLLALALGMAGAGLLANWAELQGGLAP